MPDLTTNIGLKKPAGNETADIDMINENMDIIDAEVAKKASATEDGRMSKEDKTKLDSIEDNANNYQHPSVHPATMITEDSTHRFVTDSEKSDWNSKETPSGAQAKADTAEQNAKNYADSIKPTKLSQLSNDVGYITAQRAISDSVTSTSSTVAASSKAVKTAYDKAVVALNTANSKLDKTSKAADSDKLDGKNYTEFMTLVNLGTTNQDPNTTTYGHILTKHGNAPDSVHYWHIQTYFYSTIGGNAMQIAVQYNSGNAMYVRSRYSGTWTAWAKVWTNMHDGSGSGLDADMVDGLHFREYNGSLQYYYGGKWKNLNGNAYDASKIRVGAVDHIRGDVGEVNILNITGSGELINLAVHLCDNADLYSLRVNIDGSDIINLSDYVMQTYADTSGSLTFVNAPIRFDSSLSIYVDVTSSYNSVVYGYVLD
ncbi:hypothetical protein FQB35_10360 [Crassaminicella thermophila]|uniref:Phage tail fibre repeat-containing protein n=1 Tax=Crassaminicella thermophila TaxID=2599308 RepID=A0A5C0SEF3_CRATE|nr:pyocin knob domain-containing protein [Crassaminicella thermophila]QEK12701.1 hypothetical protein FQB35_10360 [Crassaminicella thermophila]